MVRRYKLDKEFTRYILAKHKGSVVQAADTIGCHPTTIRRACKKHGIKISKGRKNSGKERRRKWSKFAEWLRENEHHKLPDTIAEIANTSGCSYKTVWMYFYNRRKRAKEFVATEPWSQGDEPRVLETLSGIRVPDKAFKNVRASVGRPTGRIRLHTVLHTGQRYTFEYTLDQLMKIYEA